MTKWVGLKNYAKEKLQTATSVALVVSGLSFVIVKDVLAATLPSQVYAWLSPVTNHSVIQSAVLKWKEATRTEVFSLWGWTPEVMARIQQNRDPETIAEAKAKQEAEKKIEDSGLGECVHCKEELIKNERGCWESEFLIEYCKDARDHKHKPKIVWKKDG